MPLFHLVYCSTAVRLFEDSDLERLLVQSRDRNRSEGVTGMLLYHRGGFMQVLEGEEASVRRIMRSILKDERHHDVNIVLEEPIDHREFETWRMAFRKIDRRFPIPDGYSDFLTRTWRPVELCEAPAECHRLLLYFRQTVR